MNGVSFIDFNFIIENLITKADDRSSDKIFFGKILFQKRSSELMIKMVMKYIYKGIKMFHDFLEDFYQFLFYKSSLCFPKKKKKKLD